MDTVYLIIIIVLLLVGVVSLSVIKLVVRLFRYQHHYPPQHYNGYSEPYSYHNERNDSTGVFAVLLVIALGGVLYHYVSLQPNTEGNLEAYEPSIQLAKIQHGHSMFQDTVTSLPTDTISSSSSSIFSEPDSYDVVLEDELQFGWQLAAFSTLDKANEYATEWMYEVEDLVIYDTQLPKARYKIVCARKHLKDEVRTWKKQRPDLKGFVTTLAW
jgi:hypothetical protein